jgi:hypothetical protein
VGFNQREQEILMRLYDINKDIENTIEDMFINVDEETGEVKQEYVDRLNELQIQKEEKLENIGCYIKNLNAEIKAIKAEEDTLKERRKVLENKSDRVKKYVASILNGEKFESAKVVFSFRKSDEVNIVDESLIPDEYMRTTTKIEPNKDAIKKAIKEGKEVRGAFLVDKNNMSVK